MDRLTYKSTAGRSASNVPKQNVSITQADPLLSVRLTAFNSGAVILSRVAGGIVTENDARALLEPFGALELCVSTQTGSLHGNLYGSVYVKFAYYLDFQDALKVGRHRV